MTDTIKTEVEFEDAGEEVSFEDKYQALEQQCYLMYLQLNTVTKLLKDREIITQDELAEGMEELNKTLVKLTLDIIEEEEKSKEKE